MQSETFLSTRQVLEQARDHGREWLSQEHSLQLMRLVGVPMPVQGIATDREHAARIATGVGFPVVLKIASDDIVHKSDIRGVRMGLSDTVQVGAAFDELVQTAASAGFGAASPQVLVQQQIPEGLELLVGATTDASLGKLVAIGWGGVLVEAVKDVEFRLAPITKTDALRVLSSLKSAHLFDGYRGSGPIDRDRLAGLLVTVGELVTTCKEIQEIDLNPVIAGEHRIAAVDIRVRVDFAERTRPRRLPEPEALPGMQRIMRPRAIAVIGASAEEGKIGNSVMRNLIDGGFRGEVVPVHPKAPDILGRTAFATILDVPIQVDVAVFCIPARFVASVVEQCGRKGVAGAILIPSGFAEVGNSALQAEVLQAAKKAGVRLIGPNTYGYYHTHASLCATFCTPYGERGGIALSSQSGGVGMAIIGFSRSARMGVSAIVGLGNKADIDEGDLLTFFEQDANTTVIAMHVEDFKDGKAFLELAERTSKTKPLVVLKAGRTELGARAASSHTGALAGDDRVYDSLLRKAGVLRVYTLNDLLEISRALDVLPAPNGENVLILTGAGGTGVLLADACEVHGLNLMVMPADLDAEFRKYIPPFGAAGNPVDITGGEPPSTYRATIGLALREPRVDAIILGYWHTIITPPMVFARLLGELVDSARAEGIDKPIVCALAGDTEVEEACDYLIGKKILAYPYTAEKPVAALGAKFRWARTAGLLPS